MLAENVPVECQSFYTLHEIFTVNDRGLLPERTLENLKVDFEEFQSSGANFKNAKFHHNVITSLFPGEITQVNFAPSD